MTRSLWKNFWFWSIAAATVCLLSLFSWRALRTVTVASEILTPQLLELTLRAPATLGALDAAELRAKVTATVSEIKVDVGDRVEAGELVAKLDDRALRAALDQALANVRVAETAVMQARSDLSRATISRTLGRRNFERAVELQAGKYISKADLDTTEADYQSAVAMLRSAEAAIPRANAEIEVARASAQAAKVSFEEARITAPFSGLVVARHVSVGDLVGPELVIVDLVATDSIILSARIDETQISALRLNQAVKVRFRSAPGISTSGRVFRVGREVDSETRELVVDLRLEEVPPSWALGQRADVDIIYSRRDEALSVPQSWVVSEAKRRFVWVEEKGRARRREVKFGASGVSRVEVLAGLRPGDVILAPSGITPGVRIRAAAP